jgi:hypothetical protein
MTPFSQYRSRQRYCHAMAMAVNSLPVRVVIPVRALRCSFSLFTPFRLLALRPK